MNKFLILTALMLPATISHAESGVEKCHRLQETIGMDYRACQNAIIGTNPNSRDAQDLEKDYIEQDVHERMYGREP
jgi:hypothetical protein